MTSLVTANVVSEHVVRFIPHMLHTRCVNWHTDHSEAISVSSSTLPNARSLQPSTNKCCTYIALLCSGIQQPAH
jgi:hypothetical protein